MSINKLLITGACMVVIGGSAGASYSLIQGLIQQDQDPEVTQVSNPLPAEKTDAAASDKFVAASFTTWIPPKKTDVTAPKAASVAAVVTPAPTALRYANIESDVALHTTSKLPLFAHIDETVAATPKPRVSVEQEVVAKAARTPSTPKFDSVKPREIEVASAPTAIVAPGTLRRFRGTSDNQNQDASNTNRSTVFDRPLPQRAKAKSQKTRRATNANAIRAVQRNARFRQTWSTGVYR